MVIQRRLPAALHCWNSSTSGRGASSTAAMANATVTWMSSALRSQIDAIDQVSALKNPTLGDR